MAQTILFLARHYPPHISGATRRTSLLVRALREEGWRVIVVAPDISDDADGFEVPHPHPSPPTKAPDNVSLFQKLKSQLVLATWLPDPDISWAKDVSTAVLSKTEIKPDWVFTTSPPESIHVAGQLIASQTGAKWAAEFRDTWLETPLLSVRRSGFRKARERPLANKLCERADLIIAANDVIAEELHSYAGETQIKVLPHFAPPLPKSKYHWLDDDKPDEAHIRLIHTGSFSLSDPGRTLDRLLQPFEQAHTRHTRLQLYLVGRLTEQEIETCKASPAANAIHLMGLKSYEESLRIQAAADALLLVGSAETRSPPGKAVEYAALNKPIIVAGECEWASEFNSGPETAAERMLKLGSGDALAQHSTTPPSYKDAGKLLSHWLHALSD